MTKTLRETIPFFSDLPTKAVHAAARLWDTAQLPNYSGPVAYRDFVQDLSFQDIPAPPRAVVYRWVAGVQSNLIDRPGGPAEQPVTPVVEMESNLAKVEAMVRDPASDTAAQAEVVTGMDPETRRAFHVSVGKAGQVSAEAGCANHQAAPPKESAEERTWRLPPELAAIAQKMGLTSEQDAAVEKLTPSTYARLHEAGIFPAATPLTFLPFASGGFTGSSPDPALVLIRNQMVNEVVAQLNVDIRQRAEAIVAARFRQIADGMEGGAA